MRLPRLLTTVLRTGLRTCLLFHLLRWNLLLPRRLRSPQLRTLLRRRGMLRADLLRSWLLRPRLLGACLLRHPLLLRI